VCLAWSADCPAVESSGRGFVSPVRFGKLAWSAGGLFVVPGLLVLCVAMFLVDSILACSLKIFCRRPCGFLLVGFLAMCSAR
jgi:hypothetical protein